MRKRRAEKGIIILMVVFLSAALFLSLSSALHCHMLGHKANLEQKKQLQERADQLWGGEGGVKANIEHSTFNIEHSSKGSAILRSWMLNVGCSMFMKRQTSNVKRLTS